MRPAEDMGTEGEGCVPSIQLSLKGAKARASHSKDDSGIALLLAFGATDSKHWPLLSDFQELSWTLVVWARGLKSLRTSSLLTETTQSVWPQISPPFEGNTEELVRLFLGWTPPLPHHLHSYTGIPVCKSSSRSQGNKYSEHALSTDYVASTMLSHLHPHI